MNMERIIEIAVRGLNAVQTNDMEYVCDNTEYIAVFDFDAEWDGVDPKTARFVYGGEHQDIVFTGDRCEIPRISDVNSMRVGVFAGNLVTTTPAQVICRRSILGKSSLPADPAPDVYAQIMEVAFPAAVAAAEESARQAAASEQNAKTSETNAEQSAKNAAESAANLSAAEQSAAASAANANAAAQDAGTSAQNAKQYAALANQKGESASAASIEAHTARDSAQSYASDSEASSAAAKGSETNAKNSADNAAQSQKNASMSEQNAATSAADASASALSAAQSADSAGASAADAEQSALEAKTSAEEASAERKEARRLVDVCAGYSKSANNSASYASDAKTEIQKSEQNIIDSAGIATASAAVAAQSEQNAKTAENNAKASEQNAAASAESAAQTLQSIDVSKESAAASAAAAAQSAQAAKTSESNASASAQAAKTSEGNAKASETNAAQSATEAKQAAESVNLPTPTPETAGKAVIVNEDGTGFEFGEAPSSGGGGIDVQGAVAGQMVIVKAVDDNGKPTEWEAANVPKSATKWEDVGTARYDLGYVIDERNLSAADGAAIIPYSINLIPGFEYELGLQLPVSGNFFGYYLVAEEIIDESNGGSVVAIGNTAIAGGSTSVELPFLLVDSPAYNMTIAMPLDGSESIKWLIVQGDIAVPRPLPEKYMPESVAGIVVRSSTEGSEKRFMITVNDSGTLTATEV